MEECSNNHHPVWMVATAVLREVALAALLQAWTQMQIRGWGVLLDSVHLLVERNTVRLLSRKVRTTVSKPSKASIKWAKPCSKAWAVRCSNILVHLAGWRWPAWPP